MHLEGVVVGEGRGDGVEDCFHAWVV
jgi:hypothetical protein